MSELLQPEVEQIRKLVAELASGAALTAEARDVALDALEQHECWAPFFRLLKRCIESPADRRLGDYVRLARVQNLYLEDVFAAAETCARMVADLGLSYTAFSEGALSRVIEYEDFAAEATILSAAVDSFKALPDLVACLERLCMLYEKKTHNETQLGKTYERLLQVDARNVKALRYFKLVFTQNNEWEEVVAVLRTLLGCVSHPQELFRVAQELAAIYLYQLDMAEEAISAVGVYCEGSPLDTSTILYDAYQRLADWPGCLKVLRQCLLTVDDDESRAILHFKIASLLEQQDDLTGAQDDYVRAVALWPQFLDAIEGVINVGVLRQDWALIETWLGTLLERVTDDKLQAQLRQAQRRLKDGVAHAKSS